MNVNHERAVYRQLLLHNVLMCVILHTLSLTSLVVGTRPVHPLHPYICTPVLFTK